MKPQKGKILIVDDESVVADSLASFLGIEGYQCQTANQGFAAIKQLGKENFDLVLTDIRMPGKTGIDLLHEITRSWENTAVVLMTGAGNLQDAVEAMKVGAADYIEKPIRNFDQLSMRINRALERRWLIMESQQHQAHLEREVQRQTQQIQIQKQQLYEHYLATLDILISTLGFHDTETRGHSRRVAEYTRLIAQKMEIGSPDLEDIELGALLHDVGKVGVPDAIIRKPTRLNPEEWEKIYEHPVIGYNLLVKHEFLRAAAPVVKYHHERYDGTGYPEKLAGDKIPIGARIFAVIDAFDVITSRRAYKEAKSIAEARAEINRCSGTHFDPKVVEAFKQIIDEELLEIRQRVDSQFGE
ncbi:MAG: response regulator [Candidatus Poribacteria bacterium]|nr:response regulator [Candidatus Poribacteria bacterium]